MINEVTNSLNLIIAQTQNNAYTLGIILLIPWCVFFISRFITNKILLLGIIPRTLIGVPGILCAPLLHAHLNHLFFNSIPLLVLSNFILINGLDFYLTVTLSITLISGLALWLVAKPGLYIGASALITGYWGFLIITMYQQLTITTVILGLLSLYYFAGIFYGLFPGKKGVSWLGHVLGLFAGITTRFLIESF